MLTFFRDAALERITGKAGRTATDRIVVDHLTAGIEATRTGARIHAFLLHARLVQGTFRANGTLGPASGRCTDVPDLARAHGVIVHIATLAVRTTGRWSTGIDGRMFDF